MEHTEKAIEAAYRGHVIGLCNVLSLEILSANGDEEKIKAAEERFKKGLSHAADVRARARVAADL